MTQRIYILPIVHLTAIKFEVPKYIWHRHNSGLAGLEGIGRKWAWELYWNEDHALLVADVTDAENTLLSGQSDVLLVPLLDNTVANATARNRVRTVLEAANIPGNWVNVGMTYRSILRIVLGLIHYHNRLVAIIQRRLFDGSVTLDMTVNQIPVNVRDRLQEAADGLGLSYAGVTGTTTIRELFKLMGDQFANHSFELGGFVI